MGGREWAMLLVLAVVWGASFVFLKVLVGAAPPLTIVFGRVALAALALNLVTRGAGLSTAVRARAAEFLALGVLSAALPFCLITFAETRISSGLASILNASTPIFTALAAHAFTRDEKLSWAKGLGVMAAFVGVTVLVGPSALTVQGRFALIGELSSLAAAVVYGLGGVYARRFRDLPPSQVAAGQLTAAALAMAPISLVFDQPWALPAPGADAWGALAGLALLSTAFAYLLYFRILATAGATNVSLVTFLVPVSAILLGALFLHEGLEWRAFAGLALIGLGLAALDGRVFGLWPPRPPA